MKSSETSDGEMLLYFKTLLGIFSFIEKELQHTKKKKKKKLMSDRYDIFLSLALSQTKTFILTFSLNHPFLYL